MSSQIDHLLNETRRFAPSDDFAAAGDRDPGAVRVGGRRSRGVLGRAGAFPALAHAVHARCSTGRTRRSRSGSTTASSTSPTTASTGTSRPATAIAWPCCGRVSSATAGASRTPSSPRRCKRLANVLEGLGIGQGDRVAIYMPMIPEAISAMLAVARIGAIHSVVFGGFSADSLRSRIDDAGAKLVITADGGYRKGKVSPLKPAVDLALADRNGARRAGDRGEGPRRPPRRQRCRVEPRA